MAEPDADVINSMGWEEIKGANTCLPAGDNVAILFCVKRRRSGPEWGVRPHSYSEEALGSLGTVSTHLIFESPSLAYNKDSPGPALKSPSEIYLLPCM